MKGYRSSESWFLSAGLCIFCGWRSKGRIEKRAERKARVVEKQKQNKHYAAVSHTSILPPAFPVSSRRSTTSFDSTLHFIPFELMYWSLFQKCVHFLFRSAAVRIYVIILQVARNCKLSQSSSSPRTTVCQISTPLFVVRVLNAMAEGHGWTILRRVGMLATMATSGQFFIPTLLIMVRFVRVLAEQQGGRDRETACSIGSIGLGGGV